MGLYTVCTCVHTCNGRYILLCLPLQAPLHLAVLTKQSNIVEILLKANANTMTTDRNGNTPLHIACQLG